MRTLIAATTAALLLISSCAWRPKLKSTDGIAAIKFQHLLTGGGGTRLQPTTPNTTGIAVTYLGSGGLLLERNDDALLIGPFFSHHWYLRLGLWKVGSDKKLIDRILQPKAHSLANVESLLIGHGHYDHLLDIPYIVRTFCPAATVFANKSVVNILQAENDIKTSIPMNDLAERPPGDTGSWIYNAKATVRFMAIASHHAPNLQGITIAKGSIDQPLSHFPRKSGGMKEGETLAYMIDFLNPIFPDLVDFRIYYQDAAEPPTPFHTLRYNVLNGAQNIDLAILCVASFKEAAGDNYPETAKQILEPSHFLLAHWENFFLPWAAAVQDLRAVPFTDPVEFTQRLEDAHPHGATWVMPTPGKTLNY